MTTAILDISVAASQHAQRTTTPPKRFPAIDGLRAFAVGIVIYGHSRVGQGAPGDLGVLLFFVLSGFLITSLLIREYDSTGTIDKGAFYMRRTLRIFPAYYAYILFSITIDTVRGHPWSSGLLVAGVSYTMDYYNAFLGHPTTSLAHAWSLAVEEQFYLLWPLAFVALWSKGRRTTVTALSIVILGAVLWRAVLYSQGASHSYLYNAFECRADALAIGCVLAILASTDRWLSVVRRVNSNTFLPIITLSLLWVSRTRIGAAYHYTIGFAVDAALCAVLMVQVMALAKTRAWSWLDNRYLRWLGVISYPCYLYHGWGMSVGEHTATNEWAIFLVGYLATIGFAAGSYYLLERPFLTLKARWSSNRKLVYTPNPKGSGSAVPS